MKIYKVGGAVRDSLMSVECSDTDWVVVGSSPEEMISKGYRPIGKDFPVFLHPKTNEEYALARTEKKTGTGYGGFTFYYGKDVTLEEDLSRRDFTINAIAQDIEGNIIDPFNGQNDIKNKIFRHVSDAFFEDPLRAIRLARFFSYSHLEDFDIDEATIKCIEKIVSSKEIADISSDRVWSETERALSNSSPSKYFEKIISLNLLDPYFSKLTKSSCNSHSDKTLRWAELQINNDFELGSKLPLPNDFKNIVEVSKNALKLNEDISQDDLILLIDKINFVRNFELINQLISLPHFSDNKDFISKLAKKIKSTDFSHLSNVSKENIEEEKIKIYKEIINS